MYATNSSVLSFEKERYLPPPLEEALRFSPPLRGDGELGLFETEWRGIGLVSPMLRDPPEEVTVIVTGDEVGEFTAIFTIFAY